MAENSKIEWTEATWNPIVGCSIVSPGCTNCYAMKMAARIEAMWRAGSIDENGYGVRPAPGAKSLDRYSGLTRKVNGNAVWTGKLARAPGHVWSTPLLKRKPTTYFVNSMGDLFHEDCPDDWILDALTVMAGASNHTFQVLTKRAARMREFMSRPGLLEDIYANWHGYCSTPAEVEAWPLPNVWLGVSAERQQEADERIPDLLATPAAVRFVSYEPALGPLKLWEWDKDEGALRGVGVVLSGGMTASTPDALPEGYDDSYPGIDWVICGGESGPNARPMDPEWARSVRDQCTMLEVPFFFKQWGAWRNGITRVGKAAAGRILDGREWNEMPIMEATP